MDQQPSQSAREGQNQDWSQEDHPPQINRRERLPATYGAGIQSEPSTLSGQQATFHGWYQDRGGAAHMQSNPEGGHHLPWSAYPSSAPGENYNQETQMTYDPLQYPPQSPHEQSYLVHTSWLNRPADSEQGYPHVQYLPPSNIQSEHYSGAPSLPINIGQPSPASTRGRRRERSAVISRTPSQTFGPYTSTIRQPSRDPAVAEASNAEFVTPHTTHTTQGELSLRGIIQTASTIEPSARAAENSQFVVPSSRIPRMEGPPYPAVSSQASTPRTSHSPEVSTETKPKRRRANAAQLRLLNETYARTMFPTTEERAEIARRINMTPRQVQIWFQNRRQASRQTQVPDSPASLGSHDPGLPQHGLSSHSTPSEHYEGSSSYSTSSGADGGFAYDPAEHEDS
ncbi:hypothetical protein FRC12_009119 [Ceratobasidium sp. 428]|nr:hypothetical protein FRC12_009119 [Ceratobasidium sp. 428]